MLWLLAGGGEFRHMTADGQITADVAIAGGGLVGLSLGVALARAGLGRPGPPATPLARPPHKTPLKGGSHAHPKLPGRPRTHP